MGGTWKYLIKPQLVNGLFFHINTKLSQISQYLSSFAAWGGPVEKQLNLVVIFH